MEKTAQEKSREKTRDFLKAQGKDPDKFLPKTNPSTPESQSAGTGSSPESTKAADDQKKREDVETQRRADANAAEQAKIAEENKLVEAKDEELDDEKRAKKASILEKRKSSEEQSRTQKRIDELVGEIKALKAEKTQDKQKIEALERNLGELKNVVEKKPEKQKAELQRLEAARVANFAEEDKSLPKAERREMADEELEAWMVEDIAGANAWLARREMRRQREREADEKAAKATSADAATTAKADEVVRAQEESRRRVEQKHPELNVDKRRAELKAQGKNQKEIAEIIFAENPKAKIVSEILKEDSDKYVLDPRGPELLAEEMERRLEGSQKPGESARETEEEKESRIRAEAAEAERQRQANVPGGYHSTRPGSTPKDGDKDEMYNKQLAVFKRAMPHLTDEQARKRLDARLEERRKVGAA